MRAWRASTSPGTATRTRTRSRRRSATRSSSGRLDPRNEYVPVRLGELNAQTRWVLERSGAPEPRAARRTCCCASRDVMRERFPLASDGEPVREVGLIMAREDVDLVPIVDDDGRAGRRDDRARARAPLRARVARGVAARRADGGRRDRRACSRASSSSASPGTRGRRAACGCWRWRPSRCRSASTAGDVVVVGDRPDAQRIAIEVGVGLLVITNGTRPADEILALARERGTAVVASPLDSYVTSAHDHAVGAVPRADGPRAAGRAARRPARRHRRDGQGRRLPRRGRRRRRPAARSGWSRARTSSTRSRGACCWSTTPSRRRACSASSTPRSSRSSTTTTSARSRRACPVRATFDPVGSTATLVIERFRQSGMEPSRPTATLLLGAILSDTVILNSPTTTDRDRAVIAYLEQVLALDATEFGREMFERTSDLARVPAERDRRARRQGLRGRRRPDAADRAGRDRRPGPARAPRRAARGARRRARARGPRARRADGHRHHGQGHRALRVRRRRRLERAFGGRATATASSTCPAS